MSDFSTIPSAELAELRRRVAAIDKLDAMNLRELAETHERCIALLQRPL